MRQPSMKLLWVFSSFGVGGPQQRFAAVAGRLGERYEHVVCALDGDYEAAQWIPEGVRWRKLAFRARKRGMVSLGGLFWVRKILQEERPSLTITSNFGALDWLIANRGPWASPHIHIEDPLGQSEKLDTGDGKRAWARRRAFPGKNRLFIAPSREIERLFVERWGAPEAAVRRIPTGLDLAPYLDIDRIPERRPLTLGAIGPLVREKRLDRMLRLGATLVDRGRDVRLLIVGEGPERATLEREAENIRLGDRIHFAGAKPDLAPYLAAMDLYVVAADRERAPRGLIAAMAAGLPVVGADVGEVGEMIDEANGIFVRPLADESAMAAAAELLCADDALRSGLGAANRERAVARYDVDVMAQRYGAVFEELTTASSMLMLPAPAEIAEKPALAKKPEAKAAEPEPAAAPPRSRRRGSRGRRQGRPAAV